MADDIDELLREIEEKFLPNAQQQIKTKNPSDSHASTKPNGIKKNDMGYVLYGAASAPVKSTGRGTDVKIGKHHSSDLVCHELEDDLSDLLSEDLHLRGDIHGRWPIMPNDAAAVALRCKRSPRRSTSAKELYLNHRDNSGGTPTISGIVGNGIKTTGNSKTEVIADHQAAKKANIQPTKCFPIYLSGVIDSIDANQTVRVCTTLRCVGCDFRVSQFAHYRWRPGTDYLFLRNHMPEFDRVRVKLQTAKFCRAYACQCKFVTIKDLIELDSLGADFAKDWVCIGHL